MKRFIIALSIIVLLLISSMLTACEPSIDIRIHNEIDETLQIFTGNTLIGNAFPGEEVVWEIERIQPRYNVTAKDMDGNIVYTADFTKDVFKGKEAYDVYFPPLVDEVDNGVSTVKFYNPIDYADGDEYITFTAEFAVPGFSFEYPSDYNLLNYQPMPPFGFTGVMLSDVDRQYQEVIVDGEVVINPYSIEYPPEAEWDYKDVTVYVNQVNEYFPEAEAAVDNRIAAYEQWVTRGWSKDFKLLERNRVMVAGIEGWEVVFSYTLLPVDLDIVSRTREVTEVLRAVFFNYQGTVWEIKICSEEGNADQAKLDYEHILGTLRILD